MAIGTLGAIALGATAIGSVVGAGSQKSAARTAADTATQTTSQNNALARDIYGQNRSALSPFMSRGNVAGDQINALLGLGGTANNNPAPTSAFSGIQPNWGAGFGPGFSARQPDGANPMVYNRSPDSRFAGMPGRAFQNQAGGMTAPMTASPQQNAFDIFRDSTGYQFRLGEGMDALNSGWAGASALQSGAAMKDAIQYGQNFASNEFNNYMGLLANQQGVGLAGASALAGVGNNYVSNVSANNNAAGTAQANAALFAGNNNPFANALGSVGGVAMGLYK